MEPAIETSALRKRARIKVDRRTSGGRLVRHLEREWTRALGGNLTPAQRMAVTRAATLQVIADRLGAEALLNPTPGRVNESTRAQRVARLALKAPRFPQPLPALP